MASQTEVIEAPEILQAVLSQQNPPCFGYSAPRILQNLLLNYDTYQRNRSTPTQENKTEFLQCQDNETFTIQRSRREPARLIACLVDSSSQKASFNFQQGNPGNFIPPTEILLWKHHIVLCLTVFPNCELKLWTVDFNLLKYPQRSQRVPVVTTTYPFQGFNIWHPRFNEKRSKLIWWDKGAEFSRTSRTYRIHILDVVLGEAFGQPITFPIILEQQTEEHISFLTADTQALLSNQMNRVLMADSHKAKVRSLIVVLYWLNLNCRTKVCKRLDRIEVSYPRDDPSQVHNEPQLHLLPAKSQTVFMLEVYHRLRGTSSTLRRFYTVHKDRLLSLPVDNSEAHRIENLGRLRLKYFHNSHFPSDWYVIVDGNTPNKKTFFERLVYKIR